MSTKRNLFTSVLLSAVIGAGAGVVSAADHSALVKQGFYGTQAQGRVDSTIRINSATKFITVPHLASAKIENDRGQNFVWQFDTAMAMTSFPLRTIAPSGFDAGSTWVSVTHPQSHASQ